MGNLLGSDHPSIIIQLYGSVTLFPSLISLVRSMVSIVLSHARQLEVVWYVATVFHGMWMAACGRGTRTLADNPLCSHTQSLFLAIPPSSVRLDFCGLHCCREVTFLSPIFTFFLSSPESFPDHSCSFLFGITVLRPSEVTQVPQYIKHLVISQPGLRRLPATHNSFNYLLSLHPSAFSG